MRATVKWFDAQKGYGFITDPEDRDFFVYHSNIVMDGFRYLDGEDIVEFTIGAGKDGREQAVNVQPVLTRKMIEASLKEENLYVKTVDDPHAVCRLYIVVDRNDLLCSSEQGMPFLELAAYAGFDANGIGE